MASKTSQVTEEITAEQVVQFLEANPDFLDQRPELLTKLHFSHQVDGATSLIERQIQVLREDQLASRQRFEQLAANAELNQLLLEKIEKFTIELLDCINTQPMVSRAHHLLKELFGLNDSHIVISANIQPDLTKGVQRCDADQLERFKTLLADRPAYMGSPPDWSSAISEDLAQFGSIAVVPLTVEEGTGYLILASRDEARFRRDMGSDFLTYIAALIGRLMDRLE